MLESAIEKKCIKNLKKRENSFTFKHPPIPTGFPDIFHLENGRLYLFEMKRDGKHEASVIQKWMHKQLRKAGAVVHVVWSWEQIEKIIKDSL